MYNDYENKNNENNNDTAQDNGSGNNRRSRGDKGQGKKQLRMGTGVVLCLLAFVVLYAIVNLTAITSVVSAVFTILTPVIIGFHIYKKLTKGVKPSENNRKPQENECES